MNNIRLNVLGIIGGVLLVIGPFLPYITSNSAGSSNLMDYPDGVIFLLLGIAIFVISLFNKNIPVLVLGIVATVFSLYEIGDTQNRIDALVALGYTNDVKFGLGGITLVAGGIVSIVGGARGMAKAKKNRQKIDKAN